MKIALICPSNMLYMPYVGNYETILKANEVDFEIINWDRFHIEDKDSHLKYRDSKIGHQRNFFDYYRYKSFLIEKLDTSKYDKVIVFGIQLTYFLKGILQKNYKGRYIIDIRDHNKIIRFFNIKKVINNSVFTVISSQGYKEWLPKSNKYIINHNTQIESLENLKKVTIDLNNDEKINIAYIGAIRDYQVNIDLINSLENNKRIDLFFHGEGDINKLITAYLKANDIRNVVLTGKYKKEEEGFLYEKSDFVNVLIPDNHINSKTLLPNRLYNAALYGKPMIAFEGTFLTEQIDKYGLGLVLKSFDGIEKEINDYVIEFDSEKYEKGRVSFFEEVIEDNKHFKISLEKFIGF